MLSPEELALELKKLYSQYDEHTVEYSSGWTAKYPTGQDKANARREVYDAAAEAKTLVQKLEKVNDRLIQSRRKLRY